MAAGAYAAGDTARLYASSDRGDHRTHVTQPFPKGGNNPGRAIGHMGLPSVAPAIHPPRPPPQAELPFDASGFEPDPPAPDDFDA